MLRPELGVQQQEASAAQTLDEVNEAHLRRVGPAGVGTDEHRLAEEDPPDVHAVEPADEVALEPGLHAVSVPEPLQGGVRLDHPPIDPAQVVVGARLGAGPDDRVEGGVAADLEPAAANLPPEIARDVERLEGNNPARVGAVPLDHARPGVGHRKEPVAVCPQQGLGREDLRIEVGVGWWPWDHGDSGSRTLTAR